MRNLKRHLRGLLVAIAALSISASAVFAATVHTQSGPANAAATGLKNAAEAASRTSRPAKPVVDADDAEVETAKVGSELVSHPLNHGWFVSQAAKAVTPAGFDNHGAYVSSIARSGQGKPTTATTATTASDPGAKGEAKAAAAKAKAAARQAARQP